MPLRAQYLADIGLLSDPYPAKPEPRIAAIYGTARRGRISSALSTVLWKRHFAGIHSLATTGSLPATHAAFDDWLVSEALKLANILKTHGKGCFGIAQKMTNLFLKDLWGFGVIKTPIETLLHAPIDRRVLTKFAVIPITWNPWTKATATSRTSDTVKDYLLLQKGLRCLWNNSPIPFPSVIQMEQFLWHPIP